MFPRSNPRTMRILLTVFWLIGSWTTTAVQAGTTHSEGGSVVEAPGVPETDGTATVQVYWTGDSATRTTATVGATLSGHWLLDAGHALTRQWLVGDVHVAMLEHQTGAGTAAHAGFYGIATKTLTSLDPDEFTAMTVRPIPVPLATAGGGFIDLAWTPAVTSGSASGIAGYNIYRSLDGIAFAKLNASVLADSTYHDAGVTFGTNYYYALGLVYAGTPVIEGTALSANSLPATPLDSTPPSIPMLAMEPPFTAGTSNLVAWSSTAASGATHYVVECAADSAFTTLAGTSGWIADSSYTFTDLTDGQTYFYRVRARDAASNTSDYSGARSSRQDATAPASHLLSLAGFKASSLVDLEWTASDATSGVASVELFYAKDGGTWTLYPGGPWTASPIAFDATTTGGDGTYAFYTLAADAVANAEAAPEAPDATTIVDTQAPDAPAIASLPAFTAGSTRSLNWTSAAATGATHYNVQASDAADFATLTAESGWQADSSYTFAGLADGVEMHYRVRSRDAAGNESAPSALVASTQDASPPVTQVTALPGAIQSHTFPVAWTGNDAGSGLAQVELYFARDGGAFTLLAGGPWTTSPIDFDASQHGGDGSYAFYTLGTDALGQTEIAPAGADATTLVDTAAPGQPVIASLPSFTAGTSRSITWSGTDATEFQAEAATDIDFANVVASSGWMTGSTWNFTSLTDGQEYFYRVQGRDVAGNTTPYSPIASSTQDATAPAAAMTALPALTAGLNLALAWSGSDATSGVANVDLYYAKNGGAWTLYEGSPFVASPIAFDAATTGGDGDYAFYVRARDLAGNLEAAPESADATTRIDTSAPGAPTIAGLQTFEAGTELTPAWSDESASGAVEYMIEMSQVADFAVLEAASDWQTERSFTFTGLSDGGRYYFRVKARDGAMNETGWSGVQSTTMDATPPASAVTSMPALASSLVLDVAWSGSDATSGIDHVDLYWSRNGGAFTALAGGPFDASPIAFDASAMGDGTYAFYTRARDGAGNLEAAPASADAGTQIDTTPSAAPILAALPTWSAGSERALAWTNESASGAVEYRAQASTDAGFGTLFAQSPWMAATEYTFTGLANATNYFYRIASRDAAGNESSFGATRNSTQDAAAPVSQLASLPALSTSMNLDLAWSGSDALSGLASVDLWYTRNGGPATLYPGGPFTSSPIAFDATTTGGDGAYAFFTRARDAAGNIETAPGSPDAQTMIDTAAPAVPVIASLAAFTPGASVNLAWSDESASGALSYHAEMSTSSNFEIINATSGWITQTSFLFGSLADGTTYWFRVKSRDAALNESAHAAAGSTAMDDTSPASQVAALPAVTSTAAFPIAWSGSDATSGIASVDLYYAREGGAYTLYAGSPFTNSPITFDTAIAGGEGQYAFYTRARDAAGNREPAPGGADATTLVSTSATGIPTLAALPNFSMGTSRTVTWTPGANNATFLVQAAEDAAFTSIHAASGWIGSASYSFNGLADGAQYWYRVKARNAMGIEGNWSAAERSTQDATAPATGVAVMPTTRTTQQFDVAWSGSDATSGIAGVELYVSRNGGAYAPYPGGPWSSSPIAFDAAALGGDGAYAFYTRASDQAGNVEPAPASADANTTIDSAAPNAPAMAAEPATTQGATNTVAWNAVADAAQYFAQCASDEFFFNVVGTTGWITATSHTFTNLAPGETYWYRVRARDAAGNTSGYSAAVASTQSEGFVLAPGWNLVSFNVTPSNPRIDLALSSIGGSFSIVRGYSSTGFRSYVPTLPLEWNDLTSVSPLSAYWIYMTRQDTLTVAGTPTATSTPIHLETGWNLAGYLPMDARTPNLALFSIAGSYAVARGYEPGAGYRSWYPSAPGVSDLTEMRSGDGFWIYMTAADDLIYGSFSKSNELETPGRRRGRTAERLVEKGAGAAVPTVMDVWSRTITVDGAPVAAGSVVEVFDGDGTLCGSATVRTDGSLGLLHLRGDVSVSEGDEGAIAGETLVFRIRDVQATLTSEPITWQADGLREVKLEFATAAALLPRAFSLSQNLPNPFNPTTTIAYAIPGTVDGAAIEQVHVRLHVYDIRGRRVATLVNGAQAPGRYTAVWNGRDERGVSAPSGVYFYRLETERFTQSRKMMLMK